MGHLAWADAFVVTADSVSMLSEACSTGYASEEFTPMIDDNLEHLGVLFFFFFRIYISSLHKNNSCFNFRYCSKPVYVIGAERCTWKISDFHNTLRERGMVRPFMGSEDVSGILFNFRTFLI